MTDSKALEFTTNKDDIINKKPSILNITKNLMKYKNDEEKNSQDSDRKDSFEKKMDDLILPKRISAENDKFIEEIDGVFDSPLSDKKYPFWVWLLALIALINSGFLGPFYLMVDANKIVKAGWRQLMTAFLMIPLAVYEYKRGDGGLYQRKVLLDLHVIKKIVVAAFFHGIWTITFAYSINYTSMAHVYILNNLDIFVNCFLKICRREKISTYEKIGFLLTIVGIIVLYLDNFSGEGSKNPDFSTISLAAMLINGNTVAFLGSVAAAFYLWTCYGITEDYPSWFGIAMINLLSSFFQLAYCLVIEGSSFDAQTDNGIFGLFTMRWFFVHIGIALVTGIGCFCLLIIVSRIFIPIHYHFLLHLEPVSGALITYFLGLQNLPGIWTWVSLVVVIVALTIILVGKNQTEAQDFELDDAYLNMTTGNEKDSFPKPRSSLHLLGRESNIEFKLYNSKRNQKNF